MPDRVRSSLGRIEDVLRQRGQFPGEYPTGALAIALEPAWNLGHTMVLDWQDQASVADRRATLNHLVELVRRGEAGSAALRRAADEAVTALPEDLSLAILAECRRRHLTTWAPGCGAPWDDAAKFRTAVLATIERQDVRAPRRKQLAGPAEELARVTARILQRLGVVGRGRRGERTAAVNIIKALCVGLDPGLGSLAGRSWLRHLDAALAGIDSVPIRPK